MSDPIGASSESYICSGPSWDRTLPQPQQGQSSLQSGPLWWLLCADPAQWKTRLLGPTAARKPTGPSEFRLQLENP